MVRVSGVRSKGKGISQRFCLITYPQWVVLNEHNCHGLCLAKNAFNAARLGVQIDVVSLLFRMFGVSLSLQDLDKRLRIGVF